MLISMMLAVGCICITSSLINLTSTMGLTVDEGIDSLFYSANVLGTCENTNKLIISIENKNFFFIFNTLPYIFFENLV